jgi:hypothetical protein
MTTKQVWLCRGCFLAFMVGFWLLYYGATKPSVTDDLLARGKKTVANPRNGLDRWLAEGYVIGVEGRVPVLKRKKTYSYEVEGRYYEDYTTREANPVGQTITYLPEDPTIHRLGVIEPPSTAINVCCTLVVAGFTSLFTFFFIGCCVLSPREDNPTRQGWWIILGLGAAQCALVFTTLYLVRQPFLVVLTRYVPAFVGAAIAALLGVRFFARRWGIKLGEPLTQADCHVGLRGERGFTRFQSGGGGGRKRTLAKPLPERGETPRGPARAAPRAGAIPEPTQYYFVTREPGRDFVGTLTWNEIRARLATGELQESCHATESDGRSFTQFQKGGGGGRWRTVAELLTERGETPPRPAPAAALLPWHVTLRAAWAGAKACLLLAIAGSLFMHAAAFLCRLAGASWSWVAFFTSSDSILMDLIMVTVATTFGAIRGVHLAEEVPSGTRTYGEIAERAANDLGRIQDTYGPMADVFERLACLFLAAVLASPVIVILLLVWFRS